MGVAKLEDWLSCPHPMEIALLIDGPVSTAVLRDLHAPMIVGRRDCECKCDSGRQHDSAKNSTEKNTSHIVPFDYFTIETRLQIGPAFENNLIGSGFAAAWQRGNFKPGAAAVLVTS